MPAACFIHGYLKGEIRSFREGPALSVTHRWLITDMDPIKPVADSFS
jgi:hypothetical protein